MRLSSVIQLLVVLQLGHLCLASEQTNLRGRRLLELTNPCPLLLRDEQYDNNTGNSTVVCELQGVDAENAENPVVDIYGVNPEWMEENNIESGEYTVYAPGATISGQQLIIPGVTPESPPTIGGSSTTASAGTPAGNTVVLERINGRRLARTTGVKTLLAVRVISADSQTSSNAATLSDSIFGTGNDRLNLASQFKACSYDKLTFRRASGSGITNGVYNLNIPQRTRGRTEQSVEGFVRTRLEAALGNNLQNRFDHVMLCLPQGTGNGGWVAYAYINSYISVFNDRWCEMPSGQMHELGHNLGLSHSGTGSNQYNDRSGLMGYSYFQDEGPAMCFNGPKSWQLGWYSDKHAVAKPTVRAWSGMLVGVAEYQSVRGSLSGHAIILKIIGHANDDYYVTFNRKSGRNSGTYEGGDQVLVSKRKKGTGYATSYLVSMLREGQSYSVGGFGDETMTVTFNGINRGLGGFKAGISVNAS